MKETFCRVAFCLLLTWFAWSPSARAQSQREMSRQAEQDFKTSDAALNMLYQRLSLKMSKENLEELKASQRLWVQFRDAEAKYEADLGAHDGSLHSSIYNGRRADLTKVRIEQISQLLDEY